MLQIALYQAVALEGKKYTGAILDSIRNYAPRSAQAQWRSNPVTAAVITSSLHFSLYPLYMIEYENSDKISA